MKKLKSNIANMAIVLTLIAVLAAGALAWVNDETSGPIEEINNAAIENGIKSVILGDRDIEFTVESPREQDGFVFHNVNDRNGNLLGTAVESTDKNGFGGALKVMVGFDSEGKILGYTVLEGAKDGVAVTQEMLVPVGDNCLLMRVTVKNESDETRRVQLFPFVEFCLWDANDDATNFQRNYSIGEVEVVEVLDGPEG